MKLLLTPLLALALVVTPALSQTNDNPPQVEEVAIAAPILLGVLVLTAAAVGAYVVIKINSNHAEDKGPVTVVLEKSADNVNWTEVCRKTVTLNGKRPIEFFEEERRDGHSFYRGRVEKAM